MVKTLIVDDELHAQENLEMLLKHYGNNHFHVVAKCSSVDEAIRLIIQQKPDLMFLDMQMPEKLGLELFETFTEPPFDVIFTTAHADYALEAIKVRPFAYLIKPIDVEEFQMYLQKFLLHFEPVVKKQGQESGVLTVQTQEQIHFLHPEDILYLSAEGSYTKIHRSDQEPLLVSKHLAQLSEKLSPHQFIRVHSKFLVNLRKISSWDKQNHDLYLVTGEKISVSYRKASELQKFLD